MMAATSLAWRRSHRARVSSRTATRTGRSRAGKQAELSDATAFRQRVALVRKKTSVVYAKPPFAGPAAVLAYLSRYTHRVAISNRRLIALDETGVTFCFKDYRRDGAERYGTMTLATGEFIRRFLLHVLPRGFHRIRHYGLLASGGRRDNLARARELLAAPPPAVEPYATLEPSGHRPPCPCCGGHMIIIETFTLAGRTRGQLGVVELTAPSGQLP